MSGSSIPDQFDRFVSALNQGDLPRATEAAVHIEESEAAPATLLQEYAIAVEQDDLPLVRTLADAISRRYDAREPAETAAVRRSASARAATITDSDALETLVNHLQTGRVAYARRSSFLATAAVYPELDDRSSARRQEVVETTTTLADTEQAFATAAEAAAPVVADIDLPAEVTTLATQPESVTVLTGRTDTVSVTVGNIGDSAARDVALSVTTPDGLSVSPATQTLGDLDGGEQVAIDLAVTGKTSGDRTVAVTVTAGDTDAARTEVDVTVTETASSAVAVLDANDNGQLETDEVQRAIQLWLDDEPVPNTGGAKLTVEQLRQLIVYWATDQPI